MRRARTWTRTGVATLTASDTTASESGAGYDEGTRPLRRRAAELRSSRSDFCWFIRARVYIPSRGSVMYTWWCLALMGASEWGVEHSTKLREMTPPSRWPRLVDHDLDGDLRDHANIGHVLSGRGSTDPRRW